MKNFQHGARSVQPVSQGRGQIPADRVANLLVLFMAGDPQEVDRGQIDYRKERAAGRKYDERCCASQEETQGSAGQGGSQGSRRKFHQVAQQKPVLRGYAQEPSEMHGSDHSLGNVGGDDHTNHADQPQWQGPQEQYQSLQQDDADSKTQEKEPFLGVGAKDRVQQKDTGRQHSQVHREDGPASGEPVREEKPDELTPTNIINVTMLLMMRFFGQG